MGQQLDLKESSYIAVRCPKPAQKTNTFSAKKYKQWDQVKVQLRKVGLSNKVI